MKRFFYTLKIWQIYLMLFIVAIVLFFIGILLFGKVNGINNGSDFGTLVSGTLGIGVSLGAMIAIIATLREQQKMNLFNKHERFLSLFQQYRTDIENLWYYGNDNTGIGIEKLLSRNLRNNTFIKLFEICENDKLSLLSNALDILMKVETQNLVMNEIWDAIPYVCKKYAGFYLSWDKRLYESRKDEKGISNNKLIKVFREEMKKTHQNPDFISKNIPWPDFIPDNIPWIEINENENDKVPLAKDKLETIKVQIKSNSKENILIEQVELIFAENDRHKFHNIHNKIYILPNSNEYFINKLVTISDFSKRIEDLPQKQPDEAHWSITPKINLYMKYKGNDWVYECYLDFNVYKNNDQYEASIIFKQIEDDK